MAGSKAKNRPSLSVRTAVFRGRFRFFLALKLENSLASGAYWPDANLIVGTSSAGLTAFYAPDMDILL